MKALVFDWYETLAQLTDSARLHFFDALAARVGVQLPEGRAYRDWLQQTARNVRFGGRPSFPLDGATPAFRSFRETWVTRFNDLFGHWGLDEAGEVGATDYADWHASADVYGDVPPSLAKLQRRYRLGVLSDADQDFLKGSVERTNLTFDVIVASEDIREYKPHISTFWDVCRWLDVDPGQAVYVGDRPYEDIEGARHAGLVPVWINRGDASWPEDMDPPAEVISSLSDLAGLLP